MKGCINLIRNFLAGIPLILLLLLYLIGIPIVITVNLLSQKEKVTNWIHESNVVESISNEYFIPAQTFLDIFKIDLSAVQDKVEENAYEVLDEQIDGIYDNLDNYQKNNSFIFQTDEGPLANKVFQIYVNGDTIPIILGALIVICYLLTMILIPGKKTIIATTAIINIGFSALLMIEMNWLSSHLENIVETLLEQIMPLFLPEYTFLIASIASPLFEEMIKVATNLSIMSIVISGIAFVVMKALKFKIPDNEVENYEDEIDDEETNDEVDDAEEDD